MTHHNADELAALREGNRKLSDAYVRLRTKIPGALKTPYAPTPEQVWSTTEAALDDLLARHPQQPQGDGVSDKFALEQEARKCLRPIRGCATDDQYMDALIRVTEVLGKRALAALPSPVAEDGEDFSRKIPKIPDGWQLVPAWLIEFLHGAGTDPDGRWFGDRKEGEGAFWWRKHLRALSATPVSPVAEEGTEHRLDAQGLAAGLMIARNVPEQAQGDSDVISEAMKEAQSILDALPPLYWRQK